MAIRQQDPHLTNRLFAALPAEDFGLLRPHLEITPLERGHVLIAPAELIRHAWFPHDGVVSVVTPMEDGAAAETATIGREGAVGFEFLTGGNRGLSRTFVQVSGSASRIEIAQLRSSERSGTLGDLLARYSRVLFRQVMQSVACNGLHSVEERCCRWLLMAHDRAGSDTLDLTQEFLAAMLGVRRPSVTVVARTLQTAGLIRYSRGAITVIDRHGLEEAACECYRVIRSAYENLLPYTYSENSPP
jgi:CRP-like cAMP-binding protein